MPVVGGGDGDGVNIRPRQEVTDIHEGMCFLSQVMAPTRVAFQPGGVDVAQRHDILTAYIPNVACALAANAERLATTSAAVREQEWSREGTRRPGERFTVERLVRFALHEVRHHRGDAERLVRAAGKT